MGKIAPRMNLYTVPPFPVIVDMQPPGLPKPFVIPIPAKGNMGSQFVQAPKFLWSVATQREPIQFLIVTTCKESYFRIEILTHPGIA